MVSSIARPKQVSTVRYGSVVPPDTFQLDGLPMPAEQRFAGPKGRMLQY